MAIFVFLINYQHFNYFYFFSCRICQEEILALSEMAQQINSKLSSNQTPMETSITNGTHPSLVGTSHQQSNESVDLDNLFAFLSEVTPSPSNTIIDDIGEKMDTLVQDLDVELENVIQQEIDGLALTLDSKPGKVAITGIPSLPEPTMPPPPPPVAQNGISSSAPPVPNINSGGGMPPLPPIPVAVVKKNRLTRNKEEEPIYEAVIPREEHLILPDLPELPLHHGIMEHKLR